jgi:pimeloyl-ACP methyl ester carboxylesterase
MGDASEVDDGVEPGPESSESDEALLQPELDDAQPDAEADDSIVESIDAGLPDEGLDPEFLEPAEETVEASEGDGDGAFEATGDDAETLAEIAIDAFTELPQADSPETDIEGACLAPEDCAGLEPGDCPGWWICEGLCAWTCPPPLDLWSRHDLLDDQLLLVETTALGEQVHEDRLYQITEVRLRSFEWADGVKTPISVQGTLAVPLSGLGVKPAVLLLHGLTSVANAEDAMALAGELDAVVLSLNGPGQGGSLGTGPATAIDVLFRSSPDPRGSWVYAYALAAARSITYLRGLTIVQDELIGVMGEGLGGAVAMVANGVDDRIRAALVIEAAGDIQTGAKQGSWYTSLLVAAGLDAYAASLNTWSASSDPLVYAPSQRGAVMIVIGAQNEFHPISTVATTYEAIQAPEKRLSLIANWDASYYQGSSGLYNTFNNAALATATIDDATRVWFRRILYGDAAYDALQGEPSIARSDDGVETTFTAVVPTPSDESPLPSVRVQYSGDGAYSFASIALQAEAEGSPIYSVTTNIPPAIWGDHNLVYFVEARYATGAGGDEQVLATSSPHRYPSFSPQIRPQQ